MSDYISREEAIEILKITEFWNRPFDNSSEMCNKNNKRLMALNMAISALSENKGEWIVQPSNKEQGERDFIWWKCSKCGHVIYSETEKDRKEFHAFCGKCGADMRGE